MCGTIHRADPNDALTALIAAIRGREHGYKSVFLTSPVGKVLSYRHGVHTNDNGKLKFDYKPGEWVVDPNYCKHWAKVPEDHPDHPKRLHVVTVPAMMSGRFDPLAGGDNAHHVIMVPSHQLESAPHGSDELCYGDEALRELFCVECRGQQLPVYGKDDFRLMLDQVKEGQIAFPHGIDFANFLADSKAWLKEVVYKPNTEYEVVELKNGGGPIYVPAS